MTIHIMAYMVEHVRGCPDCTGALEDGMGRNKISTTVYITQEQSEKLKLLHKKTKVPIAEYIREGIDMVLEKHKQHLPGQISFDERK